MKFAVLILPFVLVVLYDVFWEPMSRLRLVIHAWAMSAGMLRLASLTISCQVQMDPGYPARHLDESSRHNGMQTSLSQCMRQPHHAHMCIDP